MNLQRPDFYDLGLQINKKKHCTGGYNVPCNKGWATILHRNKPPFKKLDTEKFFNINNWQLCRTLETRKVLEGTNEFQLFLGQ